MAFTIGRLAKVADVHVETIRYYQRRGLLVEPVKPLGGVRRYGENDACRLRFIKRAQTLGFSLDEVGELLSLEDGQHCAAAEQLGARKLAIVRERLTQLRRIEDALAQLVAQCHGNRGKVRCPLIAALEHND